MKTEQAPDDAGHLNRNLLIDILRKLHPRRIDVSRIGKMQIRSFQAQRSTARSRLA